MTSATPSPLLTVEPTAAEVIRDLAAVVRVTGNGMVTVVAAVAYRRLQTRLTC